MILETPWDCCLWWVYLSLKNPLSSVDVQKQNTWKQTVNKLHTVRWINYGNIFSIELYLTMELGGFVQSFIFFVDTKISPTLHDMNRMRSTTLYLKHTTTIMETTTTTSTTSTTTNTTINTNNNNSNKNFSPTKCNQRQNQLIESQIPNAPQTLLNQHLSETVLFTTHPFACVAKAEWFHLSATSFYCREKIFIVRHEEELRSVLPPECACASVPLKSQSWAGAISVVSTAMRQLARLIYR